MSRHFQRELENLKKNILSLSTLVEENLRLAFKAFEHLDSELAVQVKQRDGEINRREIAIEEECLKLLALYQPVALDLRFIVSVLKMNKDLERIGDHAVNMTRKIKTVSPEMLAAYPVNLKPMFERSLGSVARALDVFVKLDANSAREVVSADDEIDDMKRAIRDIVIRGLMNSPQHARHFMAVMGIVRNLERIADLASNIAEDVVYMVEGAIIRHANL